MVDREPLTGRQPESRDRSQGGDRSESGDRSEFGDRAEGGDRRVCRFVDLADVVLAAPARLGPVRLVGVDGPAGAGKTTFARRMAAAIRAVGAEAAEVHTDDLLPGWTDIVAFWPRLEEAVLGPLAEGRPGGYHAYDWHAARFRPDAVPVPVPDVLVVEGVTSTRAAVRARLTLSVLVTAPAELRLARGLARDGAALRPQWLRWMADEDRHFATDPAGPPDVLVDGAPGLEHDPAQEYVSMGKCPVSPDGVDASSTVGEHPRGTQPRGRADR